jgi:hypothetical protein
MANDRSGLVMAGVHLDVLESSTPEKSGAQVSFPGCSEVSNAPLFVFMKSTRVATVMLKEAWIRATHQGHARSSEAK